MEISSGALSDVGERVRVTDDDRARTALALEDAFARGALDIAEHEQRVSRSLAARYVVELAALTDDLPGPTQAGIESAQRDSDLHEWLQEWRWWFGGAVIMSAVWGIHTIRSGPDFFWPLVPLGTWAAILIAVAIWPREDDN